MPHILKKIMTKQLPLVSTAIIFALLSCDETVVTNPTRQQTTSREQSNGDDVPKPPALHFTDVTDDAGVDMILTSGEDPSTQILEVKGGGLGLIDYDNDEDLDLFVPNGATLDDPEHGPGAKLFRNDGTGHFEDVTEQANIDHQRWSMGIGVADYNGDGYDDLYIACYGRNVLLRNTGDGRFENVTETAGVDDASWSAACSWGDIDSDGDLDLYVVNYLQFDPENPPPGSSFAGRAVFAGPSGLDAQPDTLYENLGDGTFRDISNTSGIRSVEPSYGLGAVILDFDEDGRMDIYVGNDSMANFLFRQDDSGRFIDYGLPAGIAANSDGGRQATMGIAIGDVNHDQLADIFTTNFSSDTNTLHISAPGTSGGFYDDGSRRYGVAGASQTYLGWACGLYDFDHDSDEDLLIVNGHVYPEASRAWLNSERKQPPLLYRRAGDRFEIVEPSEAGDWLGEAHVDRAAAFGDIDNDGDIDAIVGELNGPIRVLRNDTERDNWLIVELRDQRPESKNRHGIGAKITLQCNDKTIATRWIYAGGSFQSAGAQYAHFAVPESCENANIVVICPDGTRQEVDEIVRGRRISVNR